jgi:hypothetical protein
MKHRYDFELVCRCPNDKSVNIYDVEVFSNQQIDVEEFNKFQSEIYNQFMFQEDLHHLLKIKYKKVKVVGFHLGVKVISE